MNAQDIDTLPEIYVHYSDVSECAQNLLHTREGFELVDGIDYPSAYVDQDAAVGFDEAVVGFDSMNTGMWTSSSAIDAVDREFVDEVSRSALLSKQQSPPRPSPSGCLGSMELRSELSKSVSVITKNDVPQRLWQRQRYFDCGGENFGSEEDVANKRRKPCYICGNSRHNGKKCAKTRTCFYCKEKGHVAVHCPMSVKESERICLRCGETGHEIFSCNSGYSADDLKHIHCYVCNVPGHIFCGNYTDISPEIESCYNCGHCGHSGLQCPEVHLYKHDAQPPSVCCKCGEEHIARGRSECYECYMNSKWCKNTEVLSSREDVVDHTQNQLHTYEVYVPGEGIDLPLACLEQEAAAKSSFKVWSDIGYGESYGESFEELSRFPPSPQQYIPPPSFSLDPTELRFELPESESVITENVVPPQLRRWRYFDSGRHKFGSEDNAARKSGKQCYLCGELRHNVKKCPKARACCFCKEKGHFAVYCPMKINESERTCLQCGETGHEMFSCNNEYFADDLKNIQCYACNEPGHISCQNLDLSSTTVSCFNCGDPEHPGSQCPKPHLDKYGSRPPSICYKCGEVGHVARRCNKGGEDLRCYGDRQGDVSNLVEGVDDAVYKRPRRFRRGRKYVLDKMKKRKSREVQYLTV